MKYLIITLTLLLTGCKHDPQSRVDHMSNRILQDPVTEGRLKYIGLAGSTHMYKYENDTERCYIINKGISCVTR